MRMLVAALGTLVLTAPASAVQTDAPAAPTSRVSVESVTEAWQTAQVVSSCSGSGTPGCPGVAATAVREGGVAARRPMAVPRAIP